VRFLLDESADGRLYAFLVGLGHDVLSVARDFRQGLEDWEVLALARAESRILIASDRDFGELVVEHGHEHAGGIFLRMRTRDFATVCSRIAYVLEHHALQLHEFLVVTGHDVRPGRPRRVENI
jgi:predicted nuclease of predicted toxin-antitoxin system